MSRSTRREFVGAAAAGAVALGAAPGWARTRSGRAGVGFGKFRDGVASGDPSPRAVTFWSRLNTDRPRSGARLIVARDEDMRRVVATRVVPTGRGVDGMLKARVGRLDPYEEYFYMWESGNDTSEVGRTRTRPPASSSQPLRIAFSSCQSYAHGFYSPHAHAAAEDLDLYLFLGDYVYEVARNGPVRTEPFNMNDLRSYRRGYRLYRSDPALRELHRVHPSVHIWDDHEVANNYSDNRPAPSHLQRSAAYRAAFEWIPRRVFPRERSRIYRRIPMGRTADIFLLDERQYRTGDGDGQPRRILGEAQMQWLINGLRSSRARWKIIAQQVVVAPMAYGDNLRRDNWSGYPEQRIRLLGEIERAGIRDVVFLTGDAHVFMVNSLASDENAFMTNPNHPAAAMEYVGGSVTSPGQSRIEAEVQAENPWNRQFNSSEHGYAHLGIDGGQLVTEYRASDISRPDGATRTFERFVQPAGANAVQRESVAPPPPPPPPPPVPPV